jgi:hypothetical protein
MEAIPPVPATSAVHPKVILVPETDVAAKI